MKVCMLTTAYPRHEKDWVNPFIGNYAKELVKEGIEVTVITSSDKGIKSHQKINGVDVRRFSYFFPRSMQKLTYKGGMMESFKESIIAKVQMPLFLTSFLFKSIIHGRKADVIHAHWALSGLVAVIMKKIYHKPVILSVWGADLRNMPKFLTKFILNNVDVVNSFQPELTDMVKSLGRTDRMTDIHSMIDFDKFDPNIDNSGFMKEFGLQDKNVITFLGRLVEMKDPINFIRSAPYVIKELPDSIFLIAGDGPLRKEVEEEIKNLGMEKNILFLGPRYDTHIIFKSSTIFTSVSPLENVFSTTIIEAMQMGTPCLLSTAGYTPKVFIHKKYAYLVPAKNPEELGKAIIHMIKDPDLMRKLAKNGKEFIKENKFMRDDVINDTINAYNSMIKDEHNKKMNKSDKNPSASN